MPTMTLPGGMQVEAVDITELRTRDMIRLEELFAEPTARSVLDAFRILAPDVDVECVLDLPFAAFAQAMADYIEERQGEAARPRPRKGSD